MKNTLTCFDMGVNIKFKYRTCSMWFIYINRQVGNTMRQLYVEFVSVNRVLKKEGAK